VCVCLSHAGIVSKPLNVGSRKQLHVIAQPSFLTPKVVGGRPPSSWNLRAKWPTAFQTAQFRPIFAHSASTVRASEKSSISANRKSTTRFPTSHRWTVYVTPKSPNGWHKTRFCYFSVNFNFCRKTSAAKFRHVKTSSSRVVATSFLYLTVHRRIAVNVPIYLKFALKVIHPFWKRRFRQISLNSAAAVRASEKNWIIANRKSTTRFTSSHRWTVYVTPKSPKRWLKTKIFTFGVALHFFVEGNRRHLKLNMWVEHSKSQPTDDKMSLKWALPRHVTHFKRLVPLRYLWNGLS